MEKLPKEEQETMNLITSMYKEGKLDRYTVIEYAYLFIVDSDSRQKYLSELGIQLES